MNCQTSSQGTNEALFGHVLPEDHDRTHLEGLMYQYWKPETLTAERKRIRQTWFDYRHLHPIVRSFVFVREYEQAYQRAYKRYIGSPREKFGDLPPNSAIPLYRRSIHSIPSIISRMHLVDELGCPYDTFFDASIDYYLNEKKFLSWKSNHSFLDRYALPPLNMLAEAGSLIASQKLFETRNEHKLRLPKHRHYLASNWIGTSNQKACSKWLIHTVWNRSQRIYSLAKLTYHLDLLRENEVVRHLDIDTVKQMRDIKSTL